MITLNFSCCVIVVLLLVFMMEKIVCHSSQNKKIKDYFQVDYIVKGVVRTDTVKEYKNTKITDYLEKI